MTCCNNCPYFEKNKDDTHYLCTATIRENGKATLLWSTGSNAIYPACHYYYERIHMMRTEDYLTHIIEKLSVSKNDIMQCHILGEEELRMSKIYIRHMNFTRRAYRILFHRDINTLYDLSCCDHEALFSSRGIGKKTKQEIIDKAKEYGVIINTGEGNK